MTSQNLIRLKLLAALMALGCGIGAVVTVYELYQSTPAATSVPPASPAAAPAPAPTAATTLAIDSTSTPTPPAGAIVLAAEARDLAIGLAVTRQGGRSRLQASVLGGERPVRDPVRDVRCRREAAPWRAVWLGVLRGRRPRRHRARSASRSPAPAAHRSRRASRSRREQPGRRPRRSSRAPNERGAGCGHSSTTTGSPPGRERRSRRSGASRRRPATRTRSRTARPRSRSGSAAGTSSPDTHGKRRSRIRSRSRSRSGSRCRTRICSEPRRCAADAFRSPASSTPRSTPGSRSGSTRRTMRTLEVRMTASEHFMHDVYGASTAPPDRPAEEGVDEARPRSSPCWPAVAVPVARADGDPASDYLISEQVFYPYYSNTPKAGVAQLEATVADANKSGYTIRVAVITSPYDLGLAVRALAEAEGVLELPGARARIRLPGPAARRHAERLRLHRGDGQEQDHVRRSSRPQDRSRSWRRCRSARASTASWAPRTRPCGCWPRSTA